MRKGLKPYSGYRDSGVLSLGKVPEHWEVRQLGRIGRFFKGNGGNKDDEVLAGVPCVRYGDLYTTHTYFILKSRSFIPSTKVEDYTPIKFGDVLFAASGETIEEIGKSAVNLMRSESYCGGDVILFRPAREIEARYMGYATDCPAAAAQKARMGRGITVKHISSDQLKYLAIPLPPIPEQVGIVRFLDHIDRRIRRYVRAKQQLIKLLEEHRQAIIHRAITHGLDRNLRFKPSGVDWLGDIPANWEVKGLKWVTRLQRGYDLPADQRIPGPFPVVSSGGVIGTHCEARATPPGVVMGRYGSTDAVFFIETAFWPHNTALFVTDFSGNRPRWCYYLLRTISKADHSGKSAVPGIDRKDLFEIHVPLPPVTEQDELVAWMENATADLDRRSAIARRQIDLVRGYRTRLIVDVVTGNLDVREAALALPDETPNTEPSDLAEAAVGEESIDELEPGDLPEEVGA